jgi:hypothetical protein
MTPKPDIEPVATLVEELLEASKPLGGVPLYPRQLMGKAMAALLALEGERDAAVARAEACEQQAVQWKGEAMAHKSSLHEAYQVLTGAKGEPANWNGARPFRQFKEADQQAFVEWLRAWVRMKFGKVITYRTAYGARMSFNAERSDMVRETLAATSIIRKGAQ